MIIDRAQYMAGVRDGQDRAPRRERDAARELDRLLNANLARVTVVMFRWYFKRVGWL